MSLIATRMLEMRSKNPSFYKNEQRPSRYGALDLFMMQTGSVGGVVSADLKEKAKTSIGRTIKIPVIDYDGGVSIGSTRSLIIADSENTSKLYTVSFQTYAWGFTSVPVMFDNNEISMQEDFDVKFNKFLFKFAKTLDAAALAALGTAKTQVFADKLDYEVVGNDVVVPWAQREQILGDLNILQEANDHYGPMALIANGGIDSIIRKMGQKSTYNAENKTLEYMDKTLHMTNSMTKATGEFGNCYAVSGNQLGVLTRFEREANHKTKTADGHEWDVTTLPLINFPCGTYYRETVGDQSGINGAASADMDRAVKQHFGFAVDVAFITPYNSDPATIASPIIKMNLKAKTAADSLEVCVKNTALDPVRTNEVTI